MMLEREDDRTHRLARTEIRNADEQDCDRDWRLSFVWLAFQLSKSCTTEECASPRLALWHGECQFFLFEAPLAMATKNGSIVGNEWWQAFTNTAI